MKTKLFFLKKGIIALIVIILVFVSLPRANAKKTTLNFKTKDGLKLLYVKDFKTIDHGVVYTLKGDSITNILSILPASNDVITTEVKNIDNEEFAIYPNPSNGYFHIMASANSYEGIKVFNITGQLVKDIKLESQSGEFNYTLNAQSLKTGAYIVCLQTNNNVLTKKIIKK